MTTGTATVAKKFLRIATALMSDAQLTAGEPILARFSRHTRNAAHGALGEPSLLLSAWLVCLKPGPRIRAGAKSAPVEVFSGP